MVNRGIAWGLLPGVSVWVFVLIWLILLTVAVKTRELYERVGLGLILIGGGMNLLDRLRYGGVRDNWVLAGVLYNNVWDYLIVTGLLIYGYTYFVRRRANSSR